MKRENNYEMPQLEVCEVEVEQGFSLSDPGYNGFDPNEQPI